MCRRLYFITFLTVLLAVDLSLDAAEIFCGGSRAIVAPAQAPMPQTAKNDQEKEEAKAEKAEKERERKLEEEHKKRERTWTENRRKYFMPYRYPTLNQYSNAQNTFGQSISNRRPVPQYRFRPVRSFSSSRNMSRFNQVAPRYRGNLRSRFNQNDYNVNTFNQTRFVAFPIDPLYPY